MAGALIDEDQAMRLNRLYGQSLGWQDHVDSIVRLLGFSTYTPDEQTFARAVARWQASRKLKVDGVIGPGTWPWMRRALKIGPSRPAPAPPCLKDSLRWSSVPLEPATPVVISPKWPAPLPRLSRTYNRLGGLLRALAHETGIEVPAALAVWDVESGGRAHAVGRAVIRFENHLFYKLWGRLHKEAYDQHFKHGGRAGQPGESLQRHRFRERPDDPFQPFHGEEGGNQDREYQVLALATRLGGEDAALRSISIGGTQILIANYRVIGYASPRAMYDAFQSGERAHVLGFFDFCRRWPPAGGQPGDLITYLRGRRWADFARVYNGPGNVPTYGKWIENAYLEARKLGL